MKSKLPGLESRASESHTDADLLRAIVRGEHVWILDTGVDGQDDVLIGRREQAEDDALAHYELVEWPAHWTLTEYTQIDSDGAREIQNAEGEDR
jgi:hypothetical protein